MKQIFAFIFLVILGLMMFMLAPLMAPSELQGIAKYFAEHGVQDNHSANLVTAVVVNYRGFDTLGEVLVLFASVSGAGFILRRHSNVELTRPRNSGEILDAAARGLISPIIVFGAYIFIHGHLSPGGGFQGGAVIASGMLLLLLANRDRHIPHQLMMWIESLSGFAFVLIGLIGLAFGGSFLANRIMEGNGELVSLGLWNHLFSAGLIPVIYILVGLKVGAELSALLDTMLHSGLSREEGESR